MTTPARTPLRWLIWIALPATLAAALVLVFRPSRGPEPTPATAAAPGSSDEMSRMRDELALLRRQMQLMARENAPAPATDTGASAPPVAPRPTEEEASERDRRRFEGLARKLAAEPVDRSWAPATERLIADTLNKPVFKGSKLLEARCHSTLCRFEVAHDSEAVGRKFGSTLPTRLPSLPSGSMRNAEGDQRRTIVYVAREGHRVPRDDPQ